MGKRLVSMNRGSARRLAGFAIVTAVAAYAVAASAAVSAAPPPKDQCSNLPGVQKKIPAGYKRGSGTKCVRRTPSCTGDQVLQADGKCHTITTTTPPPEQPPSQAVVWWPSDYQPWAGEGTNVISSSDHVTPLMVYKPSTCKTTSGNDIPNGGSDSLGRICWSYLFQVNVVWSNGKTGCGSMFVRIRETANGVIVGDTIGSAYDVPNNAPVQIRGSVSPAGNSNLQLSISSVDCFSP